MKTVSPYRTAEDLGVRQWERDGLVALIGPLSRGEIQFDMRTAGCELASCGTVACIGGHIAMMHGLPLSESTKYVHRFKRMEEMPEHPLTALYFPEAPSAWYCTAPQAGFAVVNFLTLGEPQWDAVMRGAGT